jgi:hypothetical protein
MLVNKEFEKLYHKINLLGTVETTSPSYWSQSALVSG